MVPPWRPDDLEALWHWRLLANDGSGKNIRAVAIAGNCQMKAGFSLWPSCSLQRRARCILFFEALTD